MLPTIIWTLAGLKAIWSVLKMEPFSTKDDPRKHPERLVPLIAHGIIIGPDRKHALALGTFLPTSEYSVDWLAKQAAWLGQVYAMPEPPGEFRALWELLRDDSFRPYRRRRVPEPDAGGKELYLFDVEIDPSQAIDTPHRTILFAFVADPGEKGEIMQLPWSVTQGAVRIA
jgi:hypothetical protein